MPETLAARLALALDAAELGTFDFDPVARVSTWDPRAQEIFGLPSGAQVPYERLLELIHPDDVPAARAASRAALDPDGDGLYQAEYRIRRASDSAERWVRVRGRTTFAPVTDAPSAGAPDPRPGGSRPRRRAVRVLGTVQDVTAAHTAAEALAAREADFRAMADNIPQLAWMADPDGSIFWYNQRWYDYTGTTPETVLGWGWHRVHHPDHLDRVTERFRAAVRDGAHWEDTFPLRSAQGEWRWFLSRALPIRDAQGRVVRWFGTNTDVTEQRALEAERAALLEAERAARAEAELQRSEAEAARARAEAERERATEANRAKSQFLANMSHELRTPLNAIQGYVQLVELGLHGPVTEAQREALGRVQRAQRHLLGLINDVLNYAKLEAGRVEYHPADVPAADVTADVTPLVEPQFAAKGVDFTVEVPPGDALVVHADREKAAQVLLNLLSNAVKFTDAGGHVSLEVVAEADARARPIAVFRVRDTGRGIPLADRGRIFEPFVQLDGGYARQQDGTGLGLAISRDLARGMGGDLALETSAEGRGSVFALSLPRVLRAVPDVERRTGEERRDGQRREVPDRRSGEDRRHDADDPDPHDAPLEPSARGG